MVVVGSGMPASTRAASPPAPPEGASTLTVARNDTVSPISDTGTPTITSAVVVSDAGSFVNDVDVTTFIQHSFSPDLDVTLTSPAGTVVTLTTDNGRLNGASGGANVFNGTLWDDSAGHDHRVATFPYVDNVVASSLTPEEPLAAFWGENPNGVWTLTVHDDVIADGGQLSSWMLAVRTQRFRPATDSVSFAQTTPAVISDGPPATVSTQLDVSGVGTYACDVNLVTNLQHTFPGDLSLTLTAPSGTAVAIVDHRGGSFDNVFNGSRWDDDANPGGTVPYGSDRNQGLVSDHVFLADGVVAALVPEEALGAFIGQNPNGVWTLSIDDNASMDGGTLSRWSLEITTCPFSEVFHGVTPARLLDTRADGVTIDGQFARTGTVTGGVPLDLTVLGRGGVPSVAVAAVVLNVTVTEPTSASFVTVYPSGTARPNASNVNVTPGVTAPNMVMVRVGDSGKVSIYNHSGRAHIIVDVLGWLPRGSSFGALSPARLLETRPGLATVDNLFNGGGPIGPSGSLDVQVTGRGGVPADGVGSVALNVTLTEPTASTFLTVHPAGVARPTASNLNAGAGRTVANMVVVPVGTGGRVTVYNNSGQAHVLVDVLGWFPNSPVFSGLVPARLLDTRQSAPVGGGQTADLVVAGKGGVPATGAAAVALNVTVTEPTAGSFVTVYPSGGQRPNASNLNVVAGQTVANMVIVPLGSNGAVSLYNHAGTAHLVVDVLGWFPAPG